MLNWPCPVNNLPLSILIPPIEPVFAMIPPCRYTLSVAKPKPGFGFPNTYCEPANPLKSPSRAASFTSYKSEPVLSIISIYGVAWSDGFAFNFIYPVPTLPVDTTTCPSSYVCAVDAKSPTKSPWVPLPYARCTYILP